ncbi:hypothetical protein ES707_12700 [subsurface metagenome]
MNEEKMANLLSELRGASRETVNSALADDIKRHIPLKLRHRGGLDSISIIIDLRISKLAAAAAIIITMIVCVALLGGRDPNSDGILQEIRYSLAADSAGRNQLVAGLSDLYQRLLHQGKDVTYYDEYVGRNDRNAILMHWKLADGNYNVIFTDFRLKTVTAEQLIRLQAQMLNSKAK